MPVSAVCEGRPRLSEVELNLLGVVREVAVVGLL
jgi:hypothetical protein